MGYAHDHLRRLLAGGNHQGVRFHWHHVLGLMQALSVDPSDETEQILVEAATFKAQLLLEPGPGMPHSMPPEFLLRSLAMQLLARRDRKRYRALFRQIARTSPSERLAEMARSYLAP